MKVALTAVSFTLVCGLTFATPFAQQGTPPTNPPGQPGQGPAPGSAGKPTQPGQGTSPSQPGSPAQSDREMTLTGCLTRDTPASATAGRGGNMFLLTRARPATGAGAITSPGAAGRDQAPSGAAASLGQEYRLTAKGSVSFQEHLNHQVRVTGTMMEDATAGSVVERPQPGSSNPGWSSPGSQNPGSPSADTDARMGAAMQAPTLHVTELTMVSATCETK